MSKKNNAPAAETKKSGVFKSFLSFVFFVLILASALVLAVSISMSKKSPDILSVYGGVIGSGFIGFLGGKLCFWFAVSAVALWFGLWIGTTKRVASAVRGLGIACTLAPMAVILGELVTMLLVCAFKVDNGLSPFADSLPSQFANTAGDNFIFMLTSAVIASLGILICKIKRLPKTIEAAASSEPNETDETVQEPAKMPEPTPTPIAAAAQAPETAGNFTVPNITDINIDVSDKPAANAASDTSSDTDESLINSLLGVCHNCGARNDPNVKFCGLCGAKLL